jgi:hypothetical protein
MDTGKRRPYETKSVYWYLFVFTYWLVVHATDKMDSENFTDSTHPRSVLKEHGQEID